MKSGNNESEIQVKHKRRYRIAGYGILTLLSCERLDMQPEEISEGNNLINITRKVVVKKGGSRPRGSYASKNLHI